MPNSTFNGQNTSPQKLAEGTCNIPSPPAIEPLKHNSIRSFGPTNTTIKKSLPPKSSHLPTWNFTTQNGDTSISAPEFPTSDWKISSFISDQNPGLITATAYRHKCGSKPQPPKMCNFSTSSTTSPWDFPPICGFHQTHSSHPQKPNNSLWVPPSQKPSINGVLNTSKNHSKTCWNTATMPPTLPAPSTGKKPSPKA